MNPFKEEFNELLTKNLNKPEPSCLQIIENITNEIEEFVKSPLKPINNINLNDQIINMITQFDKIFYEDESDLDDDGWSIAFKIKDYNIRFLYSYDGIPKDRKKPISSILTTTIEISENQYDCCLINIRLHSDDKLEFDFDIGSGLDDDLDKYFPFVIRMLKQIAEYYRRHKLEVY